MRSEGKVDYLEFPGADLGEIRRFYRDVFGWTFKDQGQSYIAFKGEGADGGFQGNPSHATASPLVVLYAHDLEDMRSRVMAAGGVITRPIFSFPGGRRFHFKDPSGNELGVWSEVWIPVFPVASRKRRSFPVKLWGKRRDRPRMRA